jgi:8-oxo-dGTP diphosphatase
MNDTLPRIGSALLVRDEANRILLGQRNKDPQRGSWVIPGGKIHAFERIAEAAARELQEETGLLVEVGNQFRAYEIVNPPSEHRIVIYSWAKVVGGVPKASDDLSDVKFFEMEELGDVPVTPLVRRVLEDAGLLYTEHNTVADEKTQFNFYFIPVLLAGAQAHSFPRRQQRRSRSIQTSRGRRRKSIANAPLLFDMNSIG